MEQIFEQICSLSMSASWLILAVLLVRRLLRNTSKKYNYLLWFLVAVRLLLPLNIESSFSLVPNVKLSDFAASVNFGWDTQEETEESVIIDSNRKEPTGIQVYDPVVIPDNKTANEEKTSILQSVWICGVAVMLLYFAGSSMCLNYKLSTAVRLRKNIWQSEYVNSPFIFGVIRPRIYIPFHLEEEFLPYVLAHEKVHMNRLDDWVKAAAFLILSIYWFHPLVWISYGCLCKDIEMACDEQVVEQMDSERRKAYSRALLSCQGKKTWYHACPVGFGEVDVKERVERALNVRVPFRGMKMLVVFCCILLAVLFMTSTKEEKRENMLLKEAEQPEQSSEENNEPKAPSEAEVLAMREQVLEGMSEAEIERLKENIKTANQVMEYAYLHQNIFGKLKDKDSFYWNYFDKKGKIQIGWAENEQGEQVAVMADNRFDADNFAALMKDMKQSAENEKLQADLQRLIDLVLLAKATHEMEYANEIYKILHDMDYFLLRYGPMDVGGYTMDDSIASKYYGVLKVYENQRKNTGV